MWLFSFTWDTLDFRLDGYTGAGKVKLGGGYGTFSINVNWFNLAWTCIFDLIQNWIWIDVAMHKPGC